MMLVKGSPVFTVKANTTRSWTEWTQGFQFSSTSLQFDATSEKKDFFWNRAGRKPWT